MEPPSIRPIRLKVVDFQRGSSDFLPKSSANRDSEELREQAGGPMEAVDACLAPLPKKIPIGGSWMGHHSLLQLIVNLPGL